MVINWLKWSPKQMTQNLSNTYGDPSTNKYGAEKDILYKSNKSCKINLFCTYQLTCTYYRPTM